MNSSLGIFTGSPPTGDFEIKAFPAGSSAWYSRELGSLGIMICTSSSCNLHTLVCKNHVCRERARERERSLVSCGSKESDGELQKILLSTVCFC